MYNNKTCNEKENYAKLNAVDFLHLLSEGKITVFGGSQIRPNIHILDLIFGQ